MAKMSVSVAVLLAAAPFLVAVCASKCTSEQTQWQMERFHKTNKIAGWSECGGKAWMTRFNELAPTGTRVVFDIGCNKGYESALYFDLFAPDAGVDSAAFYNAHKASDLKLEGDLCGVCKNCEEKIKKGNGDAAKHEEVHVYCFEPSTMNFAALASLYSKFASKLAAANAHWHLVNSAVGNSTGLIKFPKECASTRCSMHNAEMAMGAAFVTSVDDYTSFEGLDHIDVLKIDTEGNDPAVLLGAVQTLGADKVGLLYFEYNSFGLWKHHALQVSVDALDKLGYECYFEGTPTLTKLTGCWHQAFEFKSWSNVVCVNRGHFMYPELEALSFYHIGYGTGKGEDINL